MKSQDLHIVHWYNQEEVRWNTFIYDILRLQVEKSVSSRLKNEH